MGNVFSLLQRCKNDDSLIQQKPDKDEILSKLNDPEFKKSNEYIKNCVTKIKIEDLSPPKEWLPIYTPDQIIKSITGKAYRTSIDIPMSNFGKNSFFKGLLYAYENHCPFVISPDMIWLLIMQAFARHVTNHSEILRNLFVNFSGKKTLTVVRDSSPESATNEDWMEIISSFSDQISENVGKELVNNITPNFTTTTPISLSTCQLTIMHTFKNYFEYKVFTIGCGFPYVKIEGSIEDWVKIKEKLEYLRQYDFSGFVNSFQTPIEEIINAKMGYPDIEFWKQMLRRKYFGAYSEAFYDGWILAFFPFNDKNKRILDYLFDHQVSNQEKMASEVLDTPFTLTDLSKREPVEYEGTLSSGFVGITQDPATYEIKPEMGWIINITPK